MTDVGNRLVIFWKKLQKSYSKAQFGDLIFTYSGICTLWSHVMETGAEGI